MPDSVDIGSNSLLLTHPRFDVVMQRLDKPCELFQTSELDKDTPKCWPMHSVKGLSVINETLVEFKLLLSALLLNLLSCKDHIACTTVRSEATLRLRQNV